MRDRSALEVLAVFTKLGLTSFGGPVAHLGYFRREFVERRRWLTERAFADLVALCQFLPGPASSQIGFAIGLRHAGLAGGLAAFAGFTAPSAVLMLAAATGLVAIPQAIATPVVHGLMLVAVAVVAHAVVGMAMALCRHMLTIVLAGASLLVLLLSSSPWMQPVVILAGGLAASILSRHPEAAPEPPPAKMDVRSRPHLSLALFAVLLAGLPLLAAVWPNPVASIADAFYRPGALVFGGGHVVLPLLEAETVERGWLSRETFLAGYGIAQAVPGPLFTFAAFLGASADAGLGPLVAGSIALVAVFLPGMLLVMAALPFWDRLKHRPRATGFVHGANAAVVGVLAAALYNPVITSAIATPADVAIALSGFLALQFLSAPPWLVVILVGSAGAALSMWT